MPAIVLADFVNGHDVRMFQVSGGFSFQAETFDFGFARQPARLDHLQRDDAVEARQPRFVNYPHPAPRDLGEQFVVAESAK